MIDSRIKADGITVANLKIMAELKGIAKNFDWKTNKLGHLTAWEKS
jgi:pyruvate dehydrogenase complex dehydrogenase (E1) component